MDAGGDGYKKIKELVEKSNQGVADLDKTITRNKTAIDKSDSILRKMDLEIVQ